ELVYQIGLDLVAGAGVVSHGNRSSWTDFDFRMDDVLRPIAFGCGDITGQAEVREGGKRDVVRASNAGFEHAAAPHRNTIALTDVVNGNGFAKPADPADLDIDDAAGAQFDGFLGVADGADGFVETNGCLQKPLQLCVLKNVIVPSRRLQYQKA